MNADAGHHGTERRRSRGGRLDAQSGHALLTTMIAAACLMPLGAFAAMQARLDFVVQHHTRAALETFVVAESGLEHALADLALDPRFDRLLLGPDRQAGTADDGTYPFAHPPPAWFPAAPFRYQVRVTPQGPAALELVASGFGPLNATRVVAATVVRDPSPYVPGALALAAGNVALALGPDFRITGTAASASEAGLPAVAADSVAAAAALAAALPPGAGTQLVGRGGTPSIADAALASAETLAAAAAQQPVARALASDVQGSLGNGLFVSPASLHLTDASGSGILVVAGMLELSGVTSFSGLIVALGNLRVDLGSQVAIDGAVLVGRGGALVSLAGAGHIAYDARIIAGVDTAFPGLLPRRARVTGWHEYADATS
jgi:hypothetical protein